MDNIILIGMPGAGKSTLGVVLAKTLGKQFIDTDLIIQEREKMLLQKLVDKFGKQKFLEIEEKAITSLEVNNSIISTGGSVIYKEKAMKYLQQIGKIVYLSLTYENIEKRINNITSRGIAMGQDEDLKSLYFERLPYYEKYSEMTIDYNEKNIESAVEEIIKRL